jgi:hypothetical protein
MDERSSPGAEFSGACGISSISGNASWIWMISSHYELEHTHNEFCHFPFPDPQVKMPPFFIARSVKKLVTFAKTHLCFMNCALNKPILPVVFQQ